VGEENPAQFDPVNFVALYGGHLHQLTKRASTGVGESRRIAKSP
jgi:hypothetical protein